MFWTCAVMLSLCFSSCQNLMKQMKFEKDGLRFFLTLWNVPLVSILKTACCNGTHTKAGLESVLAQSLPLFTAPLREQLGVGLSRPEVASVQWGVRPDAGHTLSSSVMALCNLWPWIIFTLMRNLLCGVRLSFDNTNDRQWESCNLSFYFCLGFHKVC